MVDERRFIIEWRPASLSLCFVVNTSADFELVLLEVVGIRLAVNLSIKSLYHKLYICKCSSQFKCIEVESSFDVLVVDFVCSDVEELPCYVKQKLVLNSFKLRVWIPDAYLTLLLTSELKRVVRVVECLKFSPTRMMNPSILLALPRSMRNIYLQKYLILADGT